MSCSYWTVTFGSTSGRPQGCALAHAIVRSGEAFRARQRTVDACSRRTPSTQSLIGMQWLYTSARHQMRVTWVCRHWLLAVMTKGVLCAFGRGVLCARTVTLRQPAVGGRNPSTWMTAATSHCAGPKVQGQGPRSTSRRAGPLAQVAVRLTAQPPARRPARSRPYGCRPLDERPAALGLWWAPRHHRRERPGQRW